MPESTIILTPNAQITCSISTGYCGLKVQPRVTINASAITSHKPRVKRKKDNSFLVFLVPFKKAEAPARRVNIGAQKWVIHRVKNNGTSVLVRSVGLYKN